MTMEEILRDLVVLRRNCANVRGWDYDLLINQANREISITPMFDPTLYIQNANELQQILDLARILQDAKMKIELTLDRYPNTVTTKKILDH